MNENVNQHFSLIVYSDRTGCSHLSHKPLHWHPHVAETGFPYSYTGRPVHMEEPPGPENQERTGKFCHGQRFLWWCSSSQLHAVNVHFMLTPSQQKVLNWVNNLRSRPWHFADIFPLVVKETEFVRLATCLEGYLQLKAVLSRGEKHGLQCSTFSQHSSQVLVWDTAANSFHTLSFVETI